MDTALLPRRQEVTRFETALGRAPVVLLTGPRQAGKTTLVRELSSAPGEIHYFDAEHPVDAELLRDPMLALERLRGVVVVDEAQLVEGLFPVLRVLADRRPVTARFVVLGSASADLMGLTSESLAGRIEILELGGLRIADVAGEDGDDAVDRLWRRGALPASFTASDEAASVAWRDHYITTFLTTDLPRLGSRVPTATMRRAWTMLSHYHGQTWNGAELARALDVDARSARRYLDQLTDALVVRQLLPWFVNTGKRQVRSPKIYLRDSGIFHRLQSISTHNDLLAHPKVGASWEGFVVEQLGQILDPSPMYHWRTQQGAEIDVYAEINGRRIGVEIKRSSAPTVTKSLRIAIEDLGLDAAAIVYPGRRQARLDARVGLVPVEALADVATTSDLVDLLR